MRCSSYFFFKQYAPLNFISLPVLNTHVFLEISKYRKIEANFLLLQISGDTCLQSFTSLPRLPNALLLFQFPCKVKFLTSLLRTNSAYYKLLSSSLLTGHKTFLVMPVFFIDFLLNSREKSRVVLGHNCSLGPHLHVVEYAYHPDFNNNYYSALAMVQIKGSIRQG